MILNYGNHKSKASFVVIDTPEGPRLLMINKGFLMVTDDIIPSRIHPRQIIPYLDTHKELQVPVYIIHPAAFGKVMRELNPGETIIRFVPVPQHDAFHGKNCIVFNLEEAARMVCGE